MRLKSLAFGGIMTLNLKNNSTMFFMSHLSIQCENKRGGDYPHMICCMSLLIKRLLNMG